MYPHKPINIPTQQHRKIMHKFKPDRILIVPHIFELV
ncbi:endonuclease [Candidatus Brocadia sinica JPN1]|uniref:Endonuclease n=1 Tax=Candidatus Brocadia sinica JPN1 TaxID=1197129 RepID=A0ABQ0K231_9BACT|nr:endonuclease [Candidatus Brocadia sinica JPN1]